MTLRHANWPESIDMDGLWIHWAGSVASALGELPAGGVRVYGMEGAEVWLEQVLKHCGRTLEVNSKSVLDLSGQTLAEADIMASLPDEATVVVLLHPNHPPQGFDLYSTIHRHSLVVKFHVWMVAPPLDLPEPSTLPCGTWTTQGPA